MARYYYSGARDTVESHRKIELSWLKENSFFPSGGGYKSGSIKWSRNGEETSSIGISVDTQEYSPKIAFDYRTQNHTDGTEEWKSINYSFPLEKIPCRYGGFKWFVRCGLYRSGIYCGKRARVLYSVNGYYGCRMCANLSYESCNESKRFKGGVFGFLSNQWKAEELLEKIPRQYYRGKPTRKYRKYLKMSSNFDPDAVDRAIKEMNRLLGGKDKKKS